MVDEFLGAEAVASLVSFDEPTEKVIRWLAALLLDGPIEVGAKFKGGIGRQPHILLGDEEIWNQQHAAEMICKHHAVLIRYAEEIAPTRNERG